MVSLTCGDAPVLIRVVSLCSGHKQEAHFLTLYRLWTGLSHPRIRDERSQVRSRPHGILEGKRVSVTGGAGSIGSHLVDRLIEKRAEVTALDNLSFGHAENVNRRAALLECDVTDFEKLPASMGEAEVVFHLAADATTKESSTGWKTPSRLPHQRHGHSE